MAKRLKRLLAWTLVALVTVAGALYLLFYLIYVKPVAPEVGTSGDLASRIEPLMKAGPAALIVVTVEDSGDFVQLTFSQTGIRLIYPVATERQRTLEPGMRNALTKAGCVVEEVTAGDVMFLEADLVGDAPTVSKALTTILGDAFSVDAETPLVFDHAGLDH